MSAITTSLYSIRKLDLGESDEIEDGLRLMEIFEQGRGSAYLPRNYYEIFEI